MEIVFFSTKENRVFNILKLAEPIKRRDLDIDEFLDKITQKKG